MDNNTTSNKKLSAFQRALGTKTLSIIVAILAFAAITLVYFSPILEGKRIKQHDIEMYKGMSQELRTFHQTTGDSFALKRYSIFVGLLSFILCIGKNLEK